MAPRPALRPTPKNALKPTARRLTQKASYEGGQSAACPPTKTVGTALCAFAHSTESIFKQRTIWHHLEPQHRGLAACFTRVLPNRSAHWETEGAGKAGCPLHPPPRHIPKCPTVSHSECKKPLWRRRFSLVNGLSRPNISNRATLM
jgi:hypothetical protein